MWQLHYKPLYKSYAMHLFWFQFSVNWYLIFGIQEKKMYVDSIFSVLLKI